MTFICVIPARKNSKRVKNKNIIKINGKSLISISIKEVKKSKFIDNKNIFVSTDSEIISEEAKRCGASVPFLRPKSLGLDNTKMYKVLNHFTKKISKTVKFKYVIMLQPTSPLRTSKHIDEACYLFLKNLNKAKKLVSVSKLSKNFFPTKIMTEKNKLVKQLNGFYSYESNDRNFYVRNGPAIFIYTKKKLNSNIYAGKSLMYLMSEKCSLDINEYEDLKKLS